MEERTLKQKTARTLKWNTVDKLCSQLGYAVIGIVLANILPVEDFGLVGALAIFQAFAILFVDSGFGAALLQKKEPREEDYSTVFWFNLAVSIGIYWVLFACAPLIADLFDGDRRLIPLSKVIFLTFVLNGLAIVQTNRLMKQMDVRMLAISNIIGFIVSGTVGVWLAVAGYGAWAMVWQQVSLAGVKTLVLWLTGGWLPKLIFSMKSLKEIWEVGFSVFSSSMLNTVCLNIYNFVIGISYGMAPLGIYTQADKWSKMGSASISQILTSSFVPLLSRAQDSIDDFRRYVTKTSRFTALIVLPVMIGGALLAYPVFHLLFGTKWDAAVPLFQILMVRGIFIVYTSLYSNYLLSLGKSKALFAAEAVKDSLTVVALLSTVFLGSIPLLVWGQLAASLLTWLIVLILTSRAISASPALLLRGLVPDLSEARAFLRRHFRK